MPPLPPTSLPSAAPPRHRDPGLERIRRILTLATACTTDDLEYVRNRFNGLIQERLSARLAELQQGVATSASFTGGGGLPLRLGGSP